MIFLKFLISTILIFSPIFSYGFEPSAKTINVIIPFAPGGGVDKTFRHFEKWATNKGLKFNPIYKPGGDGLIGMNEIANSPADGYHISFGTAATVATYKIKNTKDNLDPVVAVKNSILGFITHKDSNIKSLRDIINKKSTNIGYGSPGQKMLVDQILDLTNNSIKINLIPYKGGAPVLQDVLGNHIEMAVPPVVLSQAHIDNGSLRLLAVSSKKRLEQYPDVPTVSEIFPGWEDQDPYIFILPKNVNSKAKDFWIDIMKEYMEDKKVQQDFVKEFNDPIKFDLKNIDQIIRKSVESLSKK
jgi:tripartite-type tricarboxylate transporter receptor subunit TctC